MMRPSRGRRRAQELVEGPWRHNNLDAGAAMVIPVPQPLGGVVVVGEAVVTYIDGAQPAKSVPLKSTIVRVRAGHMQPGPRAPTSAAGARIWFRRCFHAHLPMALCHHDAENA